MTNLSPPASRPKRGRPGIGKGFVVGVRLQPNDLRLLDELREEFSDNPTRPEALRRLLVNRKRNLVSSA